MPTFARLVAALLYAALAWFTSELIKPNFPPETDLGWFSEFNAACGLVVGWVFVGRRTGFGYTTAVAIGLTGSVLTVFWALFLQCTGEMIRRAFRRSYDTASEAVVGIFELMARNGLLMLETQIIVTLAVGGILIAFAAEAVAQIES